MKTKLLIITGLLYLVSFVSCKKEGCTNLKATNYNAKAKKDDGTCVYPTPVPNPDPRNSYLGNYLVTDSLFMGGSFSTESIYVLQVTTGGTTKDTIYLNNLWNSGNNYIALMAGSNFSIPSQQVSGPYWASGNGNFTNNIITYQTSGDIYVNRGTGPKQ